METVRLSSKGQFVIPKHIREAHSWGPGAEIAVENVEDCVILRPARAFPLTTVDQVVGCLKGRRRKPPTERQMQAAIAKGVRDRHARGRY